jgi:flavin-binding protein dodecin
MGGCTAQPPAKAELMLQAGSKLNAVCIGAGSAAKGLSAASVGTGFRTISNYLKEPFMSAHTYKIIDLVGSSEKGIDDAIQNAIAKASLTVKNMDWFEVVETRGHIVNGKVAHFQVTIRVGFRIED